LIFDFPLKTAAVTAISHFAGNRFFARWLSVAADRSRQVPILRGDPELSGAIGRREAVVSRAIWTEGFSIFGFRFSIGESEILHEEKEESMVASWERAAGMRNMAGRKKINCS
jgi:hypothetical protein